MSANGRTVENNIHRDKIQRPRTEDKAMFNFDNGLSNLAEEKRIASSQALVRFPVRVNVRWRIKASAILTFEENNSNIGVTCEKRKNEAT